MTSEHKTEVETISARWASEDDLAAMAELDQAIFHSPWSQEEFRQEWEKPFTRMIVYTDDETDSLMIGYIVYHLLGDSIEILNIVIHPQWRKKELATKLLQFVIQEGLQASYKSITLQVRKSNEAALHLYQKYHFSTVHLRRQFYSDGEDAYQLEALLNEESFPGE